VESNHRARLRRASLYSPELRTLDSRTGVVPYPRETGRARTGTYPGHIRALCPVKLRPPRLTVKVHTVYSTAAPAGFEPATSGVSDRRSYQPELQSHRVTRSIRRIGTLPFRHTNSCLVDQAGLEPATLALQMRRSPKLSYRPKVHPEDASRTARIRTRDRHRIRVLLYQTELRSCASPSHTTRAPAKRVGRDSNSQHGGLRVPCSAIELPTRDIAEAGLEPATFSS
jgi:hypothetical protein